MIKYKCPSPAKLAEFGLTAEQHRELWGDGHCVICLKPYGSHAHVACCDHDHKTWFTRGVIGSTCNWWLGVNNDNAERFQRAANYLLHPPTELWTPRPRLANAPPRQGV